MYKTYCNISINSSYTSRRVGQHPPLEIFFSSINMFKEFSLSTARNAFYRTGYSELLMMTICDTCDYVEYILKAFKIYIIWIQ